MIALKNFINLSSRNTRTLIDLSINRKFSYLTLSKQTQSLKPISDLLPSSTVSVVPFLQVPQQSRTYKHKDVLKLRCPGCYFVKKFGILHVECDIKPRHKQVAKMRGDQVYKDDYSKGKWQQGIHWGWKKRYIHYRLADPKYVKFDWLDGKLGKEI